jgi:hypothetical protein
MRFDLHFSYWVIVWCIIYICIANNSIPPYYSLLLVIIFQLVNIIINFTKIDRLTLDVNLFVLFILKIIPFLYLHTYANNINILLEIQIFIPLFLTFILWKYIVNQYDIHTFLQFKIQKDTPILSIIKNVQNLHKK